MGPQRTAAEEIRQRLHRKARQFLFFLNRASVFCDLAGMGAPANM